MSFSPWPATKPNMPCLQPTGARLPVCMRRATFYLNFGCDGAGGGWYLCEACVMPVVAWLDDDYGSENPVYELIREPDPQATKVS